MNHDFLVVRKLLGYNYFLVCGCIWITQIKWIHIIFMFLFHLLRCSDFWLSGILSKWRHIVISIVEPWFFMFKVTWELFSCMWMFMNYWKSLVSHNFDILNKIIKAFQFSVEWKFLLMEFHLIFHHRTMIFLFLQNYLQITFMYVDVYESLKESGFLQFLCAESIYQGVLTFGWLKVI